MKWKATPPSAPLILPNVTVSGWWWWEMGDLIIKELWWMIAAAAAAIFSSLWVGGPRFSSDDSQSDESRVCVFAHPPESRPNKERRDMKWAHGWEKKGGGGGGFARCRVMFKIRPPRMRREGPDAIRSRCHHPAAHSGTARGGWWWCRARSLLFLRAMKYSWEIGASFFLSPIGNVNVAGVGNAMTYSTSTCTVRCFVLITLTATRQTVAKMEAWS